MANKKIEFPARDRFQAKFLKSRETIGILREEFKEIKQEFIRFKWYERMIEFKEIEAQLEEMKIDLEKLDAKLFKQK